MKEMELNSDEMQNDEKVTSAKPHLKLSWMPIFAIGVVLLVFSFASASGEPPELETFARIVGMTWEEIQTELPGVGDYMILLGQGSAIYRGGFAVTIVAIAAVPYRRVEKWSWYALWSLPGLISILLVPVFLEGGMLWPLLTAFLLIAITGLVAPYRKFFPR